MLIHRHPPGSTRAVNVFDGGKGRYAGGTQAVRVQGGNFSLVSDNFPDLPPTGTKSGNNPVNPGIYRVNRN